MKYSYVPISASEVGIGPIAIAVEPDMRERLFCVSSIRRPASLSSGLASSDTKGYGGGFIVYRS